MPQQPAVVADPALLSVEFRHEHQLLDRSGDGFQLWTAQIQAEGLTVGTMRMGRCLYWQGGNTHDRMVDEGGFFTQVARQVFNPDGSFTADFEEEMEMPNNLLVLDHLDLQSPWQDPLFAAALVAAAIDRFTDNYFAVLLPTAAVGTVPGAALLHRAGEMLGAAEFGEELLLIDTSLARPEEAARQVRARLRSRSHFGPLDLDDEDEYEDEGWELSPRTAALLSMALEDLSQKAWEEVSALGDEPLAVGAAGLFASLPRITFHQLGPWRREMARAFDDLAADIMAGCDPLPRCTGEEMALHLAIGRAEELLEDRPRQVADRTGALPAHRNDMDLEGCSDDLFDHDVLMLFDARLDGIEDPQDATNQTLGMVNLAPLDWFTPFGPDLARDPQRGFRIA